MAHLLGSKYCIESLQSDVGDLQSAVADVFSRVGPVRYPSWKFPDKVSCDVDVDDLLQQYCFSEDEEDCQVAHISLFELTIDRMVLLLQSFTRFTEQVLSGLQGRPATAGHMVGGQMSIGLVVKKFWNKIVQLNQACQKLQSENKLSKDTIRKLEVVNAQLQQQAMSFTRKLELNTTLSSPSLTKSDSPIRQSATLSRTPGFGGLIPPNDIDFQLPPSPARTQSTIASDTRTVACQTLETAFVPCESCSRVQLTLQDVSTMVTSVCQSQDLPSAIAKYRSRSATEEAMSAADVARWGGELGKDLEGIKKHLQDLLDQIHPLQENLKASEEKCANLETENQRKEKEMKKEKGLKETQSRQHAAKLKEVEREHAQAVMVVQRNYEDSQKARRSLEEELVALKRELHKQFEALKELDSMKGQLTKELDENITNKAAVVRLESQVQQLNAQLHDTSSQLETYSKQLGKEQAKNRSVDKHTKALQNKHDALLQRVDELDQECQELRDNLNDMEDGREDVFTNLKEAEKEIKTLKEQLQTERDLVVSMKEEKQFLETSIQDLQRMILALEAQLEESQEREKMLVQYPDLNPGLNGPHHPQGNKPSDMKLQVQSNNIRIQILEEQNNLLRKNIGKLLEQRGESPHAVQMSGGAIPLWQQDTLNQAKVNNTRTKSPRQPNQDTLYSHQNRPVELRPTRSAHSDSAVIEGSSHRDARSFTHDTIADDKASYVRPPRPPSRDNRERAKSASSSKRHASAPVNAARLTTASSNNASLSAYIQLKNAGAFQQQGSNNNKTRNDRQGESDSKPSLRSKQGWMVDGKKHSRCKSHNTDDYLPQNSFTCPACDKMYNTERDLDIHKSYCTG